MRCILRLRLECHRNIEAQLANPSSSPHYLHACYACQRVNVTAMTVDAQIRAMLPAALVEGHGPAEKEGTTGVSIQVVDEALPRRLRHHIAERLQEAHHGSQHDGSDGAAGLVSIFQVHHKLVDAAKA